jgi:uncharacterized protein (DUF983 family)
MILMGFKKGIEVCVECENKDFDPIEDGSSGMCSKCGNGRVDSKIAKELEDLGII